jgi:hypothetical protein
MISGRQNTIPPATDDGMPGRWHTIPDGTTHWPAVEHLDTPRFRARMVEWDDARAEHIMPSKSDALGIDPHYPPKPDWSPCRVAVFEVRDSLSNAC